MSRQVWIVLVALVLALAAVLLVTQLEPATVPARAQENVAPAASTSRANEPGSTLAAVPEDTPRASAPGAPAMTDAASSAIDDSELADATWIGGRVVWPEGTPLDEELWVVAKGRKFEKRPLHKVRVESDGRFRVAFAKKTKSATLALEAHYLYLPETMSVALATPPADLVLQPKLGGRVRGTCTVPLGRKDLLERARGAAVRLSGWDTFTRESNSESQRASKLDDALAFDVGGLSPAFQYQLQVQPKEMAPARRGELKIEAGKTLTFELALTEGARVSGRTLDEHGEPVAGVGLGLRYPRRSEWGRFSSDKEGKFTLAGLQPGELTLNARKNGFRPAEKSIGALHDGDVRDNVELVLDRGLSIRGRVQWPDGSPAAEALVRAKGQDAQEVYGFDGEGVRSAADGTFEISGLGDGSYDLSASARRVADSNANAADASAKPAEQDASEKASAESGDDAKPRKPRAHGPTSNADLPGVAGGAQGVVLVLGSGLSLSLRVLDDTGAPVTKVVLTSMPLGDESWQRDFRRRQSRSLESADGRYTLEGLSAGRWAITATANEVSSDEETFELPLAAEASALIVPRPCELRGRVVDVAGKPAPGARVRRIEARQNDFDLELTGKRKGSQWAECDADGQFVFDHTAAGPARLVASAADAADSAPLDTTVVAGGTNAVELALRAGGTIRGLVLARDGRPESGRTLLGWCADNAGRSLRTSTDEQGRFAFEHVTAGSWQLNLQARVSADGTEETVTHESQSRSVQIADGQTVELQFGGVDKDAIQVRGRVTRAGKMLAAVNVHAWSLRPSNGSNEPRSASARTNDAGVYELALPSSGSWSFYFTDAEGATLTRRADVPAGAAFTLDIELPSGVLRGRLVDREGRGVARQSVSVQLPAETPRDNDDVSGAHARSGDDGSFSFQSLAPGHYEVVVGSRWGQGSEARYGGARRADVIVPEKGEAQALVIVLEKAGRIVGTVLGLDGRALADARVAIEPVDPRGTLTGADAESDERGRFTVNGLSPGEYLVRAAHGPDVTREAQRVEVRSGEKSEVQLSLQRGGSIVVTALDSDGRRVGAGCRFTDERGVDVPPLGDVEPVADPAGGEPSWRYSGLPPGRYRVRAANRARVEASAEAVVTSGSETPVVLRFASSPR